MGNWKTKEYICKNCNKSFKLKRNRGKLYTPLYCSKKCNLKKVTNSLKKRIIVKCYICNKDIERKPSILKEKNFCGNTCLNKHRKTLPIWNKGKKGCFSEESIQLMRKAQSGKVLSYETRKRISLALKEREWDGFIVKFRESIRNLGKYRKYIKTVLSRDKYTCQICDSKKNLEVHHIISFRRILDKNHIKTKEQALSCKELWNIDNGITLCKKCHCTIDIYRNKFINNNHDTF